jgi:hypothetical protein
MGLRLHKVQHQLREPGSPIAPSVGSPHCVRGTAHGTLVRFPLPAWGTYRKGVSNARVLVKFGWTGDDDAYQPDDR